MTPLPFDRAHLATFTGGDLMLERELLGSFLGNAETHIKSLEDSIAAGNWSDMAHRFKGAAAGIGMQRLADLCAQAEALHISAQADTAKTLLAEMRSELETLAAYLKAQNAPEE
ncbi:MAG: Hpt domain-containing protein [Pseudomonadota bacterium]